MVEFRMPSLGADMEAGTLVAYRCEPGTRVARGDIIAEIETDKGVIEVESYVSGVLDHWLVQLGAKVPVGTALAVLREEGDAVSHELSSAPANVVAQAPLTAADQAALKQADGAGSTRAQSSMPPAAAQPAAAEHEIRATPSARRRARELGVDLAALMQYSPVTASDIERAAAKQEAPTERAAPAEAARPTHLRTSPAALKRARELGVDLSVLGQTSAPIHLADVERLARSARPLPDQDLVTGPRRAIAAAMSRAKREIPHYYVSTTVDLAAASHWLEAQNVQRSVHERMLLGVLFLRAVALATQRMPDFNVCWTDAGPLRQPDVHLGVAIALRGGGLVSPAIASAAALSLSQLMAALQDLVARARSGRLRSSELSSGTITVTSLGERGVDSVYPIVNPPQSAIVGFGRSALRPWVANGELCVRPLVQLTLAADHRITDGHAGARYLALIEQLLQQPERL